MFLVSCPPCRFPKGLLQGLLKRNSPAPEARSWVRFDPLMAEDASRGREARPPLGSVRARAWMPQRAFDGAAHISLFLRIGFFTRRAAALGGPRGAGGAEARASIPI
jgi:hypothetical protein